MATRRPLVVNRATARESEIPTGDTVPTDALGSGTANTTTFLRGDGAWSAVVVSNAVVSVTGAYAVLAGDSVILANSTTAAFSITLPTAVGATGKAYTVKKLDASLNAVTLATTSAQTIDGGTTATLSTQYISLTVISDGANWQVV